MKKGDIYFLSKSVGKHLAYTKVVILEFNALYAQVRAPDKKTFITHRNLLMATPKNKGHKLTSIFK